MKKIMFNDKYGLTDAVLNGNKTQTRRIGKDDIFSIYLKQFEKIKIKFYICKEVQINPFSL